jgi:hypothetical protein
MGLALAAHGAQKLLGWFGGYGLTGTGQFLEQLGFRPGRAQAAQAGLIYDNLHLVNSDPGQPKGGQPHRYSLWEIHPVAQFVVCGNLDNTCDPSQPGDWIPLDNVD